MNLIVLSIMYDFENEARYKRLMRSKSLIASPNVFQHNLIDGIARSSSKQINLQVFNVYPFPSFPFFRKAFFRSDYCCFSADFQNDLRIHSPRQINFPFLKQLQREHQIVRFLKNAARTNDDVIVLLYSLYKPFVHACRKIKKRYPSIKVVPIVTDLLGPYAPKPHSCSGVLLNLGWRSLFKAVSSFDGQVLLTEQMRKPLRIPQSAGMVMEGVAPFSHKATLPEKKKKDPFIIGYFGTIQPEYGLDLLVEAVRMLRAFPIKAIICGGGDYLSTLRERCSKDENISILGHVAKKDLDAIYKKTHILINPRPSKARFTEFSFPSKTIEYLDSGIPFISFSLPGIPKDYDEYINYPAEESAEALAKLIKDIMTRYDYYVEKASNGARFIREKKNPVAQGQKLIDYLMSL